jgi:hypothetical protein
MLPKMVYWLAVIVISFALVVALILFFESQDQSSLDRSGPAGPQGLTAVG